MANEEANGPYPYFDFDRDRGIFTPNDRRFLAGVQATDLSAGGERHKRWRLRNQVKEAIQDLAYLRRMKTRDIGQIVEDIDEQMYFDAEPWEEPDPEKARTLARILAGTEEVLGLFRELYAPDVFERIVERQLGIRAALDHYDEHETFGVFDVTVEVKLKDEMSIDELKNELGDTEPVDLDHAYPGWWEVLDRHGDAPPLQALVDSVDTNYSPPSPEEMDTVVGETIAELYEEEGAPRERVIRVIAEKEDISLSDAANTVEEALLSGECYKPDKGLLRPI